jgi:indolepyruvate ferredoxin oxidoreductase beta subunit
VAAELGDARLANTVMLGAAADLLPLTAESLLEQVLERFGASEGLRRRNALAFAAGRERATNQRH